MILEVIEREREFADIVVFICTTFRNIRVYLYYIL